MALLSNPKGRKQNPIRCCILGIIVFSLNLSAMAQWIWIAGNGTADDMGSFGIQGVPNLENNPPSRSESVSWKDDHGNFWIFGGKSPQGLHNDLWCFDIATHLWTWEHGTDEVDNLGNYGAKNQPSVFNLPPARWQATSWSDLNGNLWLFGGAIPGLTFETMNDLWKYDIKAKTWTWCKGSSTSHQSGVYGQIGIPDAANTPGSRNSMVSWTDTSGNLWLFGGYAIDSIGHLHGMNDLWKYDVSTNIWTWVKGSNKVLGTAIYGTKGEEGTNNTPGARYGACSWTDSDGNFWLFGGNLATSGKPRQFYNDLWKFNVRTQNWSWMNGSLEANTVGQQGQPGEFKDNFSPRSRRGATACSDGLLYAYLFGGNTFSANNDFHMISDLWCYEYSTNRWSFLSGSDSYAEAVNYGTKGQINPPSSPGARSDLVSWMDANGNGWIFGGSGLKTDNSRGRFGDVWRFNAISQSGIPWNDSLKY